MFTIPALLPAQQSLDDQVIDDRLSAADTFKGVTQCSRIVNLILEQIATAFGACGEKPLSVGCLGVGGQQQNADIWMAGAELFCRAQAFVGEGGRHTYVEDRCVDV